MLCEKPLAPDRRGRRRRWSTPPQKSDRVAAVGFTFRRSPAINAIRQQVLDGGLGPVRHFNGHYWCDYGFDPHAPMSWRYRGGPGSGALADIGSHLVDLGEFFCGPIAGVRGARVDHRRSRTGPRPLGAAVGHAAGVAVSDDREPVENEDICTFTADVRGRRGRHVLGVPGRVRARQLAAASTCSARAARRRSTSTRPAEFTIVDGSAGQGRSTAYRQVLIGPAHPYIARGLPMDFPSVGHGQNDFFVYQARAFLDQIAGIDGLPPCPDLAHGLHNLRVLDAVVAAAGKPVSTKGHRMKLGAYTACLHDRSLPRR